MMLYRNCMIAKNLPTGETYFCEGFINGYGFSSLKDTERYIDKQYEAFYRDCIVDLERLACLYQHAKLLSGMTKLLVEAVKHLSEQEGRMYGISGKGN